MGFQLVSKVLDCDLRGAEKTLLIVLAQHVNDTKPKKGCWQAVPTLAREAGLSDRTVQSAIKNLIRKGYITRIERVGRSSIYLVHPFDPRSHFGGETEDPPTETATITPEVVSPHPRKYYTSTPEESAPEKEMKNKEKLPTLLGSPERWRSVQSVSNLLRRSDNPLVRRALQVGVEEKGKVRRVSPFQS